TAVKAGEIVDAAVMSRKALAAFIGEQIADAKAQGVLFSLFANADYKDSANVIAYVGQGGLGLPEKGYYFDELHEQEDPFGYRSRWYEERKRALLLASLSQRQFNRG
ncbi:NADP-dependent isocitrate dehydrogenase, partial [Stenotrophomonas sp. 3diitr2024]|uniref:NADP-dependent isocitrate dehydrogenase n=1 Tax=Stenotrophomonas sp. 3diitr2024 TaxID=3345115 RepID=UPI0035C9F24D